MKIGKESNLCIKKMLQRKTCWFIIDRRRRINDFMYDFMINVSCMVMHYIVEENALLLLLQPFIKNEILKLHIKDCFKINSQQRIIMPEKVNTLIPKNMREK